MGKKSKNKSLGRGLGAILGEVAEAYENEFKSGSDRQESVVEIPLSEILPNPYQPRKHFDEDAIRELAESIKRHGLLQPVVVIEQNGEYVLIAGERRVRASRAAGLETIRAIVADIDRSRFRELALIENIQREALNPIELARSYKELIEEYGITQEELARTIHKSRAQITNTLRLLQLDDYVLEKLASGQISQGHAKVLVGLDEKNQRIVCDTVTGQKLSVRETEQLVSNLKREPERRDRKQNQAPAENFDLTPYADIIKEHIPFKVKVKKGRVEIELKDEGDLKSFLKRFSK
ncbi:chromosome (plasmid) partitioning protein ParB [Hydrogenimonas sp.]|nr:chromosome (plasmid) partitioning protein ParB [Hydrogenimonas sp.]